MQISIDQVIFHLKSIKDIHAAYIYGSFSKGDPSPKSDLDIALFTSLKGDAILKYNFRISIATQLSRVIGREVDLVLLEDSSDFFRYEILKTGKLIYEANMQEHRKFVANAVISYFDYQYLENIMRSGMLKAIREGR